MNTITAVPLTFLQ